MLPTTCNSQNHRRHSTPYAIPVVSMLLFASLFTPPGLALADPPPWAPAHGYYKNKGKHQVQPSYRTGDTYYTSTYLRDGHCNREALGQVLGGVVGGVAGSNIGKGDDRTAATIVGTIVGAVIGGSLGHSMDVADMACVGQTLEYGQENSTVAWVNPDTRAQYQVTPGDSYQLNGDSCREFTRDATIGGRQERIYGTACRQTDGSWHIVR